MAFGAVSSDAALAGSLLSGYGGPGQGNQELLGSALLHKPGGGSGSGGAGSSGSGSGSSSSSAGTASPTIATNAAPSNGQGSASRSTSRGKPRSSHLRGGAARSAQPGRSSTSPPSIASVYDAAERGGPAPSAGALGLSGADLLLILLTLGMLALIGALSWRLARSRSTTGPRPEGGG
jgi:hypothetical protein